MKGNFEPTPQDGDTGLDRVTRFQVPFLAMRLRGGSVALYLFLGVITIAVAFAAREISLIVVFASCFACALTFQAIGMLEIVGPERSGSFDDTSITLENGESLRWDEIVGVTWVNGFDFALLGSGGKRLILPGELLIGSSWSSLGLRRELATRGLLPAPNGISPFWRRFTWIRTRPGLILIAVLAVAILILLGIISRFDPVAFLLALSVAFVTVGSTIFTAILVLPAPAPDATPPIELLPNAINLNGTAIPFSAIQRINWRGPGHRILVLTLDNGDLREVDLVTSPEADNLRQTLAVLPGSGTELTKAEMPQIYRFGNLYQALKTVLTIFPLVSVILLPAGAGLSFIEGDWFMGAMYLIVATIVLGISLTLYRAYDVRRTFITVDEDGFTDHSRRFPQVRYEDIQKVTRLKDSGTLWIAHPHGTTHVSGREIWVAELEAWLRTRVSSDLFSVE